MQSRYFFWSLGQGGGKTREWLGGSRETHPGSVSELWPTGVYDCPMVDQRAASMGTPGILSQS